MYIIQIYWEICMMKRLFDGCSIHKKHDYANIMLSINAVHCLSSD